MKKIYLSILFLFVFLVNTFSVSLPGKLEFLGFSRDNKWAFFRGIDPENSISTLSYFIYDTKKRAVHAKYKNPAGLIIWNRYYDPSQIERGLETRSYQGYSVTLETQTEILDERQSGVSGNNSGNILQSRKLYVRRCVFNLEYHRYNVYKRIRLFEYNISLIENPPLIRYRVWWKKNARAAAIIILSSNNKRFPMTVQTFIYALSW